MSAKNHGNYRFTFLLKLACPEQPPSAEFVKTMAETSGATLMLFAQGEQTAWLHLAIEPLGKPLSRKFFSETHKGNRVLANAGLSATETPLPQIDLTLKQLAADPAVTGLNEAATTWLSQNRANAAIATAVATRSDAKDSLLKQLKLDFLKLLAERDPCPTATEFMNSFYESGNPEAYIEISANLSVFSTIRDNFVTHTRATRKEKPMRESLQEFCEARPLPEHIPSASALTAQAGYRGLVEAMAQTFVIRRETKKRAIWFHGAPNCGKTFITRLLAQIFLAQDMLLAEGKYTLVSSEHSVATQLVLLDEANFNDLFKPSNLPNVKLFFEGRGYLQRVMMQTPRMAYQGACVFLTSNGLPALSKPEPGTDDYDWAAIRTRTTFFKMTTSHSGRAQFPFDATVLAHAILETASQHEPSLSQCTQPEEEKHQGSQGTQRALPAVPSFPEEPSDPILAELLSEELTATPQPTKTQKPDSVSVTGRSSHTLGFPASVLGKRPAKLTKQVHGQQTLVGEPIILQRPKRQTQLPVPPRQEEL